MLFKRFVIDPCGKDGTCLVKASCQLYKALPWERTSKCPDYKKYTKRRDFINAYTSLIINIFCVLVFLCMIAFIIASFSIGAWDILTTIYNWF